MKCPICGREVMVREGEIDYHDKSPPARALCPASKITPADAENLARYRRDSLGRTEP